MEVSHPGLIILVWQKGLPAFNILQRLIGGLSTCMLSTAEGPFRHLLQTKGQGLTVSEDINLSIDTKPYSKCFWASVTFSFKCFSQDVTLYCRVGWISKSAFVSWQSANTHDCFWDYLITVWKNEADVFWVCGHPEGAWVSEWEPVMVTTHYLPKPPLSLFHRNQKEVTEELETMQVQRIFLSSSIHHH